MKRIANIKSFKNQKIQNNKHSKTVKPQISTVEKWSSILKDILEV